MVPLVQKRESGMNYRVNGLFILLTLILSVFIWSGCTDNTQPSDEDIVRAIDDSGIMKRADESFTVVPPVIIMQRGERNKDGSWPVKVKFTLTYKMGDGRTSLPTETTTSFRILRAKDNAGKSVWKALAGS
jgi:hypothetical protein